MGDAPDIHEIARQVAIVEERMNTMDERYDKGWALLREDMAKRDAARLERDAARSERDAARSERDAALSDRIATATDRMASSRWWQTAILSGVIAAVGGIVTAIILAALD